MTNKLKNIKDDSSQKAESKKTFCLLCDLRVHYQSSSFTTVSSTVIAILGNNTVPHLGQTKRL